MEDDYTKNIIQAYFDKHFSRKGQSLFGRWLRAGEGAEQKTEALRNLWENSLAKASASTGEDWYDLQHHLRLLPVTQRSIPFYQQLWRYAAVAVFTLLIASSVFYVTDRTKAPKPVQMAEFFVPYGESRMVTLPDSSTVWVDAGSLLVYPSDFDKMDSRSVYLTGKASFTVKKDPQKPFIVKTTYLAVEALGTVFTVKSYPTDLFITTTLEQGSVRVDMMDGMIPSSILKPNEELVYSHKEHTATIHSVDASLSKMEREGYLIFSNVSFSQLMASLERKFNVVIQYNVQRYANEYYNVKFAPNESIEDVLDVLRELTGLNYKRKRNVVFIN